MGEVVVALTRPSLAVVGDKELLHPILFFLPTVAASGSLAIEIVAGVNQSNTSKVLACQK